MAAQTCDLTLLIKKELDRDGTYAAKRLSTSGQSQVRQDGERFVSTLCNNGETGRNCACPWKRRPEPWLGFLS